ncbi:hypothetical protein DIPPA_28760 [Diplonema papillatum]|nr:hypothetical protein DIPPA_28760 [Diplonema papillatum]
MDAALESLRSEASAAGEDEDDQEFLTKALSVLLPELEGCEWDGAAYGKAAGFLLAACEPRSARDVYLAASERLAASGGDCVAACLLLSVLDRTLARIADSGGKRAAAFCKSTALDVPGLLQDTFTQSDASVPPHTVSLAPNPASGNALEPAEQATQHPAAAQQAGAPAFFANKALPSLLGLAATVEKTAAGGCDGGGGGGAAGRRHRAAFLAAVLAACAGSQRYAARPVAIQRPPLRRQQAAPPPPAPPGAPTLREIAGEVYDGMARLADGLVACAEGGYNGLLLLDDRVKHYESVVRGGSDEEGAEGEEDADDLDQEENYPGGIDYAGVGACLAFTRMPRVLQPGHVLVCGSKYWSALLLSPSAVSVALGLRAVQAVLQRLEPYSLAFDSALDESSRADDLNTKPSSPPSATDPQATGPSAGAPIRGSEGFEKVYHLAQALTQVMTQNVYHELRVAADAAMQGLVKRLRERTRLKMYTAIVRTCPYPSVVSLVVTRLKEEIHKEYGAVAACDEAARRVVVETSAFLQPDVFDFCVSVLGDAQAPGAYHLLEHADVAAAVLSLLLFVVMREARSPVLNLRPAFYKKLVAALDALETTAAGIDPSTARQGVQGVMMISFSLERLREALPEKYRSAA